MFLPRFWGGASSSESDSDSGSSDSEEATPGSPFWAADGGGDFCESGKNGAKICVFVGDLG